MIIMTTYGSCDANEKTVLKDAGQRLRRDINGKHIYHQGYGKHGGNPQNLSIDVRILIAGKIIGCSIMYFAV